MAKKAQKRSTSLNLRSKNPKSRSKNLKNAPARKKVNTSTAQPTDNQQYIFTMEKGDNIAHYDEVGGAIELFLPEFVDYFEDTKPDNWIELTRQFVIGVLIHEDIHKCISDTGTTTSSEHDHHIMDSLFRPDKS